ncbi:MAG TPA: SHOCT domain-containing protein [Streptosporangiaceae bacterium]|nr:SHOCT domain-containing protein [Streptosporangiaceae bacterium]
MPDQLSQLTALREQGALTDAEFSTAKAKLLG